MLGLLAAVSVRVDLGDELLGQVPHRKRDQQHHGEALGDRRGGDARCAHEVRNGIAAREDQPTRERRRDPEPDRALDRGQYEYGPIRGSHVGVAVLRPRDQEHDGAVGDQLYDTEHDPGAGTVTLGDVRDAVHRPETADEQDRLGMGERARRPQAHEHERADEQSHTPECCFDRHGRTRREPCTCSAVVRVLSVRHLLLRIPPVQWRSLPDAGTGCRPFAVMR